MGDSTSSSPPADISVWIQRLDAVPPASGRLSSPDLRQQLKQTLRRPVDRAVCLETDIDPRCDLMRRFAAEHAKDVQRGLEVLRQILRIRIVRIGERSPRRVERSYPHLLPSLLIKQLFGRLVRPHRLPTDAGVLFIDAISAAHLGAMADNREPAPLPLMIDDEVANKRIRLTARPGEAVADVLARCGVTLEGCSLRHGPPLAQRELAPGMPIGDTDLWLRVTSTPTWLNSFLPAGCTRAGACVSTCPVNIQPAALLEARQRGDAAMGERFGVGACVECGLCTAACPSHLPLLPAIRELKRLAP